jgi:hypothetical protein
MATIKLQGNSSGSGTVILTAPNTNSNRTYTLPDRDVDFGNMGAPAVVSTLNGTGTIALQTSTGVSSVTDNGSGRYQFNFSANFSTSTYYAAGVCSYHNSNHWTYLSNNFTGGNQDHTRTTSQCKVGSYDGGYIDTPSIGLMASD